MWIGAESGSQKILDAMNKGTRVPKSSPRAACWARRAFASDSSCSSVISARSSTTFSRRASSCDEARPDDVGVSVSYPLPGTKFYELVKEQLGDKTSLAGEQRSRDDVRRHIPLGVSTASVRDLLHDQVTQRASPALQQRWDELMRSEEEFRAASSTRDSTLARSGRARR